MIWILVPAFNEESSLPILVPKIKEVFQQHNVPFQLVIVNDGSNDKTAAILNNFLSSKEFPLSVITHKINRGLGETERDGFEYIAEHCHDDDIIVRIEGDDTHEPEYVFALINKIKEGYDVVNTSRFEQGGGQMGLNSYRTAISRLANLFMKIVFNIPGIKDYSCGFRAYRAVIIKNAIKIFGDSLFQLRGLGFTSTLEIVVKLNLMGCKFAEVPFVLRYDKKQSESKMIGSITSFGYLVLAVLNHWPFRGWKYVYKKLKKLYPADPEKAVAAFKV